MGVACYAKVLIFTFVLLFIDLKNLAEAKNEKDTADHYRYDYPNDEYPSDEYPGDEYPDSRSSYIFFHSCNDYLTTSPKFPLLW